MTSRFPRATALLACLLLTAGLWGCRENTILGSDLIPAGDSISTIRIPDTFTVQARSVYDDSVVTSYIRAQASTQLQLGSIYQSVGSVTADPFFGRTHSVLYFEPAPALSGITFPAAATIDSAVLVLPYGGITWGDTVAAPSLRVRVFQTGDTLRDTFYYSNQRVPVNRGAKLGEKEFYFRDFTEPVFVDGASRPAQLRMQLDTAVLMPLVRNALAAGPSQSSFVSAFRGLCIEPDTNKASSLLPYFLFSGGSDEYSRPGFVVYYRDTAPKRVSFFFQNAYGNAYTYVKRNYGGSPAFPYLFGSPDPNVLLLQNEPGAAIDIRMPYIQNLPRAVYNKAELVLTKLDTAGSDRFYAPSRIFPYKVAEDGSITSIADRLPLASTEPTEFIDGRARTVTVGSVTVTQYVLNFPRELQQAVNAGRPELHLRINGLTSLPGAYRLIAGGRNHPQWGLKVNVAYSKQ